MYAYLYVCIIYVCVCNRAEEYVRKHRHIPTHTRRHTPIKVPVMHTNDSSYKCRTWFAVAWWVQIQIYEHIFSKIDKCINTYAYKQFWFTRIWGGNNEWDPYIMCCSVLQCVAVCCSVLQCVAVCCSVLQVLHCAVVCCSVSQCVGWNGVATPGRLPKFQVLFHERALFL